MPYSIYDIHQTCSMLKCWLHARGWNETDDVNVQNLGVSIAT
jgi:hypothetical protein